MIENKNDENKIDNNNDKKEENKKGEIKGYEINETKNSNSLSKEELKELPSYEYIRIILI